MSNPIEFSETYLVQVGELTLKGGNIKDFEKRILEFIQEIKEKYEDKTPLVVAHGGVAKLLIANFRKMPETKNLVEIDVKNCEILEFNI